MKKLVMFVMVLLAMFAVMAWSGRIDARVGRGEGGKGDYIIKATIKCTNPPCLMERSYNIEADDKASAGQMAGILFGREHNKTKCPVRFDILVPKNDGSGGGYGWKHSYDILQTNK